MRTHWKYIVVSLIIGWLIGASSGILGIRCMTHGGFHNKGMGRMREHVFKDLNLTPQQKAYVDVVLKKSRGKIEVIRNEARQDIRTTLTQEQQKSFDTANARQDAKRKKWKASRQP